jgi:hypothetical protein
VFILSCIFCIVLFILLKKTEGAIKNGQSRNIGKIEHAKHSTKTNKTKKVTTQKNYKDEHNTYHTKNQGWTHVLEKGKQFLLLIESSPIKVLSMTEKRGEKLRKREKIHFHFRNGYFVTVTQIVMTTVDSL